MRAQHQEVADAANKIVKRLQTPVTHGEFSQLSDAELEVLHRRITNMELQSRAIYDDLEIARNRFRTRTSTLSR